MWLHKAVLLALIGLSFSANANLMHVKGKSGGKSKAKVSRSYKGKSSSNKRSFAGTGNSGSQFSCGKRMCGQMNSCAEARFHLNQCGVRSLDRDRDGIPCESLCGG